MQFREGRSLATWRLHEFHVILLIFFVILFRENHFCSLATNIDGPLASSSFYNLAVLGRRKFRAWNRYPFA